MKLHYIITVLLSIGCGKQLEDGLYARIATDKGDIILKLYYDKAPLTVANFVGLAEGQIENDVKKGPYYDGLTFHRVIGDFVAQGGCPIGDGTGGPGYRFVDEISPDLIFDKPGLLAMANSGPATNGSQFFITYSPQPHLNGKHTIFGSLDSDIEVLNKIEEGDLIKKIEIIRVGKEAKNYKVENSSFKKEMEEAWNRGIEEKRADREETVQKIKDEWPEAKDLGSEIFLISEERGGGRRLEIGDTANFQLSLSLLGDGSVIFNDFIENIPVGQKLFSPALETVLPLLSYGDSAEFVASPESSFVQGAAGGMVPADSWIIFQIKVTDEQ